MTETSKMRIRIQMCDTKQIDKTKKRRPTTMGIIVGRRRLLGVLTLLSSIPRTSGWCPLVAPLTGTRSRAQSTSPSALASSRYTDDSSSSPYWEDDEEDDDDIFEKDRRYGSNDRGYDGVALQEDVMEWERCQTDAGVVHVLLPPPTVLMPTCVIHFTGGTFFGSAPNLWYRQLLQDIVKNTQAAVIATSIPVTLLQSPLQHVKLAKKVQQQFQTAWKDVLYDEYGEELQNVPVCGMGHSLGARLMVVLATLGALPEPKSGKKPRIAPPFYKSAVLVSFTNYGAAAGIPGIYQLNKASRKMEEDASSTSKNGRSQKSRQRRADDWLDDDDYESDEDWGELFQELQNAVRDQAGRVQTALTPSSQELEFFPTPEQLWTALGEDSRYSIPQTLVVQFDNDEVDQSSKLALALAETSNVKFARIRGTHLTPVSVQEDEAAAGSSSSDISKAWFQQINSRAGRVLWAVLKGRQQADSNEIALRELRQSVARYITEIVTK
jgi:hypothetical protein